MHTKLSCSWSNPYVHVRLQADFSVFTPIHVACKLEISENESSQKSSFQLQIKFLGGWPWQHWHFQVEKGRKLHTNHIVAGRIHTYASSREFSLLSVLLELDVPENKSSQKSSFQLQLKIEPTIPHYLILLLPKVWIRSDNVAKRLETSSQEISYAWVIGICHLGRDPLSQNFRLEFLENFFVKKKNALFFECQCI